jgi:hypothetical protein
MPSHDSFFKRLLRAFFPDLVWLVLPETARQLDFRHSTFLDKELPDPGSARATLPSAWPAAMRRHIFRNPSLSPGPWLR